MMKLLFGCLLLVFVLQQANACMRWCFATKRCYPPAMDTCTDCIKGYCGEDFMHPFETDFGRGCILDARRRNNKCKMECGDVTAKQLKKWNKACKQCLAPCIAEAKEEESNYCDGGITPPPPPSPEPLSLNSNVQVMMDMMGPNNNTNITLPPPFPMPCQMCFNNKTCPTQMELMEVPPFCLIYLIAKCSMYGNPETAPTNMTFFECMAEYWHNPCSECPPEFNATRFITCQDCLGNCHEKMECASNCTRNQGMYPMSIPCAKCAALCRITPGDPATCMANNCPDCDECDACFDSCEAEGYATNNCRCIQRYYPF